MAEPETSVSLLSVLPIDFDIPEHYVPLEFFISVARDVATVAQAFNDRVFEGTLQQQIVILPPEEGSFRSRIGLLVRVGGIALVATPLALENDIAKGFIEGLTGKSTREWALDVGTALKNAVDFSLRESTEGKAGAVVKDTSGPMHLVKECTKIFLEKSTRELGRSGVDPSNFPKGFEAKNDFYSNCLGIPRLQAVRFSSGSPPIQRTDFSSFIVPVVERLEEQATRWVIGVEVVKVTSPNWDDGDKQRLWKAQDEEHKDRYFRIEDEHFWQLAKRNLLEPAILNVMKVQWAYKEIAGKKKEHRVLRVLEFNHRKLSDPLDGAAMEAVLGTLPLPGEPSQLSLPI